jgi:hypothetical protein
VLALVTWRIIRWVFRVANALGSGLHCKGLRMTLSIRCGISDLATPLLIDFRRSKVEIRHIIARA